MTPNGWTFLAEGSQTVIVVLTVGVICLVMWMATRRRAASGRSPRRAFGARPAPRDSADVSGRREVSKSMQDLLLELEELSREINSQVDTRLRALNLLVQEADEKIRTLRELGGSGAEASPPSRTLPPPPEEPHAEETERRYARVYTLSDEGRTVVEIAREMAMMTGEVELILALRRTAGRGAEDTA